MPAARQEIEALVKRADALRTPEAKKLVRTAYGILLARDGHYIAGHPDHLALAKSAFGSRLLARCPRTLVDREPLAHRLLPRPELARERFVDDRHFRRGVQLGLAKRPAAQRKAERLEKCVANEVDLCPFARAIGPGESYWWI